MPEIAGCAWMADQSQVDAIRERLIQEWILSRLTVDGQIDGLAAIASAYWTALAVTIGSAGTRATLSRARTLAQRKHPRLASVVIVEGGLDLAALRRGLRGEDPAATPELLGVLVEELCSVLRGLLGSALLPILREVEAELAAQARTAGSSPTGEEEQ
jgi:hypothetical protein